MFFDNVTPTEGSYMGSHGGSGEKNPPVMQETRVQSLGREDPLEKGKAAHCSILAWKSPWTEEPGRIQCLGSQSQTQLGD